ncbi:MAG TPA: glycosyltransferase [Phenylobacterium sp.]
MVRFSIVVPTYKRADLLKWTIESLHEQSFQDWEAIIVDDGSDDPELTARLAELSRADPRVRTFSYKDNRGLPAARNHGIAQASGEYICFLDSDDLYFPWSLEVVDQVIASEGGPSFIAGTAVGLSPDARVAAADKVESRCETFRDFLHYRSTIDDWWFAPSGVVVKASVVRHVGGFWSDRHYCEDIDLWLRLGDAPKFVRIRDLPTYAYRLHGGSMHHNQKKMYSGIARILERERQGRYPGGARRRRERIESITATARHQTLDISIADRFLAWKLYLKMLAWNVELQRWKFILGFPMLSALRGLRSLGRT